MSDEDLVSAGRLYGFGQCIVTLHVHHVIAWCGTGETLTSHGTSPA